MSVPAILISPLNWGLGHASRMVPIIAAFENCGCKVTLAASGASKLFLQQHFPQIEMLDSPHFEINYRLMAWLDVIFKTPAFLKFSSQDHQWLQALLRQRKFDAVISDNRYGMYNGAVRSVLITHQLNPTRKNFTEAFFSRLIHRFNELWIPDVAGPHSLSGELSINKKITLPTRYLGVYSRLQGSAPQTTKKYALTAIISGPEYQRARLERQLTRAFQHFDGKACIIMGKFNKHHLSPEDNDIDFKNFATTSELQSILRESETVICRSGYSSLLDLCSIGQKAILIPTPGQPEQLYLAKRMQKNKWFAVMDQDQITLEHAALSTPPVFEDHHLQVIDDFVKSLV